MKVNWSDEEGRQRSELYAQFVKPGDLVFNVGASFGTRTEVFADLGARVIALEPQPEMAEGLRERFAGREEVTILEAAAGPEVGTVRLVLCADNPIPLATAEPAWIVSIQEKYSHNWPMEKWDREIEAAQVTLDSLIEEYGVPDFVKIDVDGYERFVLEGLSQKVRCLCFEVTIPYGEPGIACTADLAERLGYVEFNYLVQETMALVLDRWVDAESMMRVLRSLPMSTFFCDVFAR